MKNFEMPVISGEEKIAEFVRQFSDDELVERMTSRERGRILGRDPVSANCVVMEFFSRTVTREFPEVPAAIHYAAYSPYDLADFRQAILRRRAERKESYLSSSRKKGMDIFSKDPFWDLWNRKLGGDEED